MDDKNLDKLSEDYFKAIYEKDYLPNPLENCESFIRRKKLNALEESNSQMDNVFKGIFLFSLIENKNERIKNLFSKFMSFAEPHPFNIVGNDPDEMAKNLVEHNLFDLEDSDFGELMKLANYVENQNQYEKSISMYQALTVIFPQKLEGWLMWAHTEFQYSFNYEKVIGIYKKCQNLFKHPLIHMSIALCHSKGNDLESAREEFQKCIECCDEFQEEELKIQAAEFLKEVESLPQP